MRASCQNLRRHLARAILYLGLLVSPFGAPATGLLMIAVCPVDATLVPDGPLALPFVHCGLSRPLEQFYQTAVFWPTVAFAFAGQLFGVLLAFLWSVCALAFIAMLGWHLVRALLILSVDRL